MSVAAEATAGTLGTIDAAEDATTVLVVDDDVDLRSYVRTTWPAGIEWWRRRTAHRASTWRAR